MAVSMAAGQAMAADIYRCAGTTTFVSAAAQCPGGKGDLVGRGAPAPSATSTSTSTSPVAPPVGVRSSVAAPPRAMPAPEPLAGARPSATAPVSGGAPAALQARPPWTPGDPTPRAPGEQPPRAEARPRGASGVPTLPASPLAPCATEFPSEGAPRADCERAAVRAMVRRTAVARLEELSRLLGQHAASHQQTGGMLAIDKTGKPADWCEAFFNDILARSGVEVVDDLETNAPRASTTGAAGRRPLLDPDFSEYAGQNERVSSGYVTLRWRGEVHAFTLGSTCLAMQSKDGCRLRAVQNIIVEGGTVPRPECAVSSIRAGYWPQYQDQMVAVRMKVPVAGR